MQFSSEIECVSFTNLMKLGIIEKISFFLLGYCISISIPHFGFQAFYCKLTTYIENEITYQNGHCVYDNLLYLFVVEYNDVFIFG